MDFLRKLRETFLAIAPILLVVVLIHVFIQPLDPDLLVRFIFSSIIICVGQVLFLSGTDNSIMPMGEMVGNTAGTMKNVGVLVFFSFIFGLFATVAEPDVNVLATVVVALGLGVPKVIFMFVVGAGVGFFVALSLLRIIKSISYKVVIFCVLLICFVVAKFVPESMIAVAFDAGGATTGIVTSPFLLAITAGIARNKSSKSHSDNFGVIGLTSLGPILAVLFMSLVSSGENAIVAAENLGALIESFISSVAAILPLVLVFYLFDILFIKLPRKKKTGLALGSMITFFGLFLFLFGINFGFLEMGEVIGSVLSVCPDWLFLLITVVIGFVIAFSEPAIRVLGAEVEDVTQGNITRTGVTIAIAIAMMLAVVVSGLKIILKIDIYYILLAGYAVSFVLMCFAPKTFTALAFDSGGVASGPMTASFLLPIMIGFAGANGNASGGFGLIAIVGMMPVFVLGVLGVLYRVKVAGKSRRDFRLALRISYAERALSNMDKLEEEWSRKHMNAEIDEEDEEFAHPSDIVFD